MVRFASVRGRAAILRGDHGVGGLAVDVHKASGGEFGPDPDAVLARWAEFVAAAPLDAEPFAYSDDELGPPVARPRQVFAVALNYRPHAAEAGYAPPSDPLVFTKFPSCLTGPGGVIDLPPGHVDWELELVVVIGRECRDLPAERAWDVVAGLTIGQDLSERLVQTRGTPAQFGLGKSFPGFGPIGPALVTPDELADPDDLELTCTLSGGIVQQARTSEMIFSVPDLLARLSAVCTLYPGDLVFTGTPAGVGNRHVPPRFLTSDDELISEIEGLGRMTHSFRVKEEFL